MKIPFELWFSFFALVLGILAIAFGVFVWRVPAPEEAPWLEYILSILLFAVGVFILNFSVCLFRDWNNNK